MLITTLVGMLVGALGMGLLGVNLLNSDLEGLQERLEQGEILMILSVPLRRVNEIRELVARLHLQGDYQTTWPSSHAMFP